LGWKLINIVCRKFYRYRICRKIGIFSDDRVYLREPFIAIIVEAYIDLAFASFMQMFVMATCESAEQYFNVWFNNVDNGVNSLYTIFFFVLLFLVPAYAAIGLTKWYRHLRDPEPEILDKYGYFIDGLHCRNRLSAFYILISMIRRFAIIFCIIFLPVYPTA